MTSMDEQGEPVRYVGMGAVLIGDELAAPGGSVAIQLPGAVIDVDPSGPGLMPSCLVADVELARPVVTRLFGEAVADAMLTVRREWSEEPVYAPVTPGPMLAELRRLAEVRWCQQHTLLSVTSPLLELEELTLQGRLSGVIAHTGDWRPRLLSALGELMLHPEEVEQILAQPAGRRLIDAAFEVIAAEPGEATPLPTITLLEPIPGTPFREVVTRTLAGWTATQRPRFAQRAGDHRSADRGSVEAHRLTCAGVAALRLYAAASERVFLDAAVGALAYAADDWDNAGRDREAAAVSGLLDLAVAPRFQEAWPVTPTAAEQAFVTASEPVVAELRRAVPD